MLKRFPYIVVLLSSVTLFTGVTAINVLLGTATAHATCYPGFPCTEYDLYTDYNANYDEDLNGPKSGKEPSKYNESTCDANFMNQIYSKAFMEGRRQVIMSEQLIHKPDSVLEYSCFDGYVSNAATNAPIFSQTTYWQNHTQELKTKDKTVTKNYNVNRSTVEAGREGTCSETCAYDLGAALTYLIGDLLTTYINNNFSHTYLGEASTIDYAAGSGIGCADMATIWEISKCLDFSEDDRFRSFYSLIDADPRTIPKECSHGHSFTDDVEAGQEATKLDKTTPNVTQNGLSDLCPPSAPPITGVLTGFSANLIRLSNNCPQSGNDDNKHAYASVDLIELIDHILLGVDGIVDTYVPGTGGSKTGVIICSKPVPTGIPVITYEHKYTGSDFYQGFEVGNRKKYLHYEHICSNPGCYYRPIKMPLTEILPIPSFDSFAGTYSMGMCIGY